MASRSTHAHLLKSLRVAGLLLGLMGVLETSMIVHLEGYRLAWLAPVGGYAMLVWVALRGREDDWRLGLVNLAAKWFFRTSARALSFALGVLTLDCAAGFWLRQSLLQPNFVLIAYERQRLNPSVGVSVSMEDRLRRVTKSERTDSAGVAAFRLDENSFYECSLEMERSGATMRTVLNDRIDLKEKGLKVDVAGIPGDRWKEVEETVLMSPFIVSDDHEGPGRLTRWYRSAKATLGDLAGKVTSFQRSRLAEQADAMMAVHSPWGGLGAPLIATHREYVVGFDPDRRLALWVAFKVNPGAVGRRGGGGLKPDAALGTAPQASDVAYRGSGYVRGRLVSASEIAGYGSDLGEALNKTSIVVPQDPVMNRTTWVALESYCRKLAESGDLWVISGPVFAADSKGARLSDGTEVPVALFRVLVRRNSQGTYEALGFLVPNRPAQSRGIAPYLVAIGRIQEQTGLAFFPSLPVSQARSIASSTGPLWIAEGAH